jgi:hypothetical protein
VSPEARVFEVVAFDDALRVHICSAQGVVEALIIDHQVECEDDALRESLQDDACAWERNFEYYGEFVLDNVICDVPEDDVRLALEELEIESLEGPRDRAAVLEKIAEFHGQNSYC